nr:hypothetical protein [Sulfolobus sp. E11-6]
MAGVHLVLTHAVLPNSTATMIYDTFFGFTSALAIIAAVLIIQGLRYSYPLITIFYTIDLALLSETRLGPALFVGKKLPFNYYVDISLALVWYPNSIIVTTNPCGKEKLKFFYFFFYYSSTFHSQLFIYY